MGGGAPEPQPLPKVPGPNNKGQEAKRRGVVKATQGGGDMVNLFEDYVSATFDPNVLKRTTGGA